MPVTLGILIAASHGQFDLVAALLTIIGACFVQLGLNVANDVFDTIQGADDANVTPTQFSGGSRVIQYGLVSLRQMATLSTVFYVLAGLIGLVLLATHGSTALLVIGVVGFVVSLGYTAPPLKFVYRGLGEIAVALGFGPLMLLGAYVVQTGGALAWEPFVASIPVALLVALILYVNEIPDRRGDARAHKLTLPVRFSQATVIGGYNFVAAAAFVALVLGVVAGILPIPALLMLLAIPLAVRVSRGLAPNYDNPYALMAVMGVNVKLHLYAGLLLLGRVCGRADRRRRLAGGGPLHRLRAPGAPQATTPRAAHARAGITNGPLDRRSRQRSRRSAARAGIEARHVGAGRADALGERRPPRVETGVLEVGAERRLGDVASGRPPRTARPGDPGARPRAAIRRSRRGRGSAPRPRTARAGRGRPRGPRRTPRRRRPGA